MSSFFIGIVFFFLMISVVLGRLMTPQKEENCTVRVKSRLATAVKCQSNAPQPLTFNLSILFTQTVSWRAGSSWKFALEDASHHLTPLDQHCASYQA